MRPRVAATLGVSKYALRGAALAVGREAVEGDGMKRRELEEGDASYMAELLRRLAGGKPRGP